MDFRFMWASIVMIVFLSIASSLISQWIRTRYRAPKSEFEARLNTLEEQSDLVQLEELVRVLESIITDPNTNLSKNIESL